MTDTAGDAIEAHQKRRGRRVLGYRRTLPVFNSHGYDFDGAPDPKRRSSLYQNLGADVVIESSLKPTGDRLVLETRERQVFTDRVTDGDHFEIESGSAADRAFVSGRWWSRLLPNTAAIDLAPTRTNLSYDGTTYPLAPPAHAGFVAQSLDYLSSIKITSLPARRFEAASHWTISLVPTIRASRRRLTIPDLETTADQDRDTIYTRLLAGAGYGPEVGLQSGKHYIYFNVLPILVYSRINAPMREIGAWGLQFSGEFGYLYFVTKSWNLRAFVRSQTENDQLWQRALGERLTHGDAPVIVSTVLAGVSVGYRFEPRVRFRRGRGD